MDVRHDSLHSTLESTERKNLAALKRKQPEPVKGEGVTLVTAWARWPATVVSVEPRRLIVQEDEIVLDPANHEFRRNMRGTLHFFKRRINSAKWNHAGEKRVDDKPVLGIIIGERQYEEPDFYALANIQDVIAAEEQSND